jgi:hypothetical protein|nr:MAG TPA: hypothetical protein [Caudoviricetes sp.]
MYSINLYIPYENFIKSYTLKQDILDDCLMFVEKDIKLVVSYLYENNFLDFRLEVINTETKDIRNIIWESKKGFLEACSIEKYIRHLINKETYQIWITDYANDESICKFAD